MSHIASNIFLLRKKVWKESQEVFSARLGMSRTNLARVESGEYEPSLSASMKLSATTGISLERLVNEELGKSDFPRLPIGEGGEAVVRSSGSAPPGQLGDFADLRKMAMAIRELQADMGKVKSVFGELDEEGVEKLELFNAVNVVIKQLEKGLDESEYSEEKKKYLSVLAAHLSAGDEK